MENMIESVLRDIRAAEETAAQMEKDSYNEGKRIVLDAENEANEQLKNTVAECKKDRKAAIAAAEKRALENRNEILRRGNEQAEKLAEQKNSAIEENADKLVSMILKKY